MFDFEKDLNKEQLKVVREGDGPCLVLSGPGSGKTRTLVYRAAYLLKKNIPPSRILLLTFTKKAAKEMLSRIYNVSKFSEKEICGGTFHHMGNVFLRKHAEEIGYNPNFIIIDEEDGRGLLKTVIEESEEEDVPKAPVVQKIVSLSVNSQKDIKEIIEKIFPYFDEEIAEKIIRISEVYQKRKKKNNLMDYNDLLFNWNKLLSIKEISDEISRQFLYILIDEYQDTNALQNEIIKKIGKIHKNILVVGDDAQSIYSFRAADIENILGFPKNYPEAKIFKLEENYRSVPEILDVANMVIKNNSKKLEKKLRSTKKEGQNPKIISISNSLQQASFISDYLEKEKDISDTAVLFRAHYHSIELEIELAKRGIPYVLRGGVRFFEQHHVKDVVAFLKIFLNFHDEPSWRRIFLRQEGVGEVTVKKIIKKIFQKNSLDEVLNERESITNHLSSSVKERVSLTLSLFESSQEKDVSEKIKIFLEKFYYHYLDLSFENAKERKNDLKRLRELSFKYNNNLEMMLSEFSLSEDFQSEEQKRNGVILSTIHQAKGLEWETVFIISLREGSFPHTKSIEDDLLEEERRLFYVAVTRCKRNLFLMYPLRDFRDKQGSSPSRFLKEAEIVIHNTKDEIIEDEEIIEIEGSEEWEAF